MTPIEAYTHISEMFPIEGYMAQERSSCLDVARCVLSYLRVGSSILDIGSGPCDKAAVLQALGYRCFACDDLRDPWHRSGDNLSKIRRFAHEAGVCFQIMHGNGIPFRGMQFCMVMLNHVLEHLHESPRAILTGALECLEEGGLLFLTVPSAVSIRKRVAVVLGRSNLPNYGGYFWSSGRWRGHVREYTRGDLASLCEYMRLEPVFLGGRHQMTSRVKLPLPTLYKALTTVWPDLRDSWLSIARKPKNWHMASASELPASQ